MLWLHRVFVAGFGLSPALASRSHSLVAGRGLCIAGGFAVRRAFQPGGLFSAAGFSVPRLLAVRRAFQCGGRSPAASRLP